MGRIGQIEDTFDLAMGKTDLVLPALEQVLGRVGMAHALGEAAKPRLVAHGPMLDGHHSGNRIVDARISDAAELRVQFFQPFLQLAEKIVSPDLIVLEGHAQTLDRLAVPALQLLFVGFLEQLALPGGFPEKPAGPAIRFATWHSSDPRCPCRHPRSRGGP